jgi:predicted DNA-binding protein YlxM (UPF0122 family)
MLATKVEFDLAKNLTQERHKNKVKGDCSCSVAHVNKTARTTGERVLSLTLRMAFSKVLFVSEFLDDSDDLRILHACAVPLYGMRRRRRKAVPKIYNFAENVVPQYNNRDFRQHFRIGFRVFEKLFEKLEAYLRYDMRTMGKQPISPRKQLLIFIWYIANQDSMREIANMFGVSRFTVHRIVRRVSKCICNNLKHSMISWPDEDRRQAISNSIASECDIEKCIGFIDGTHIRLTNIPAGDTDYVNRKGFPSIQLQLVVDDSLVIQDAYVGWPGCCHNARVYRNSPLFHRLSHDNGTMLGQDYFLIGEFINLPCYIYFLFECQKNHCQSQLTCSNEHPQELALEGCTYLSVQVSIYLSILKSLDMLKLATYWSHMDQLLSTFVYNQHKSKMQ